MRNEPDGHHGRELLDAALRHRIGHRVRDGEDRVDGGHVDDGAAPSLSDHLLGGGLADQERRLEVHPLHLVEHVLGKVDEVADVDDAGIVDQDVEAAEGFDGFGHHGVRTGPCEVRQVRGVPRDPVAQAIGLLAHTVSLHVHEQDLGAFRVKPLSTGQADALGGAGHDRDLVRMFQSNLLRPLWI